MMSNWFRVDDFDNRIQYSSSTGNLDWTGIQVAGSVGLDTPVLEGAFLGTGHRPINGVVGTNSSFTFAFNGTGASVYAMYAALSNPCGHIDGCTDVDDSVIPIWECLIDDVAIPSNKPFRNFPLQSYCEITELPATNHILTVNVPTHNTLPGSPFWLDFIQYIPNPDAVFFDQGFQVVDSTASQITELGPKWEPLGPSSMVVSEDGDYSLQFTGMSLTWYGLSMSAINKLNPSLLTGVNDPTTNSTTPVTYAYAIDEGPPISFGVANGSILINSTSHEYDQIMFKTPQIFPGSHKLTVSIPRGSPPFTLDYLLVETNPLSISDFPVPGNVSKIYNDPIIGGTIGGAAVLLFLVLFLYYRNRWRSLTKSTLDSIFDAESLREAANVEPFKNSLEEKANIKTLATTSSSMATRPTMTGNKLTVSAVPAPINPDPFIDPDNLEYLNAYSPSWPVSSCKEQYRSPSANPIIHVAAASHLDDILSDDTNDLHRSHRSGQTHLPERGIQSLAEGTMSVPSAVYSRSRVLRHADSGIRISHVEPTDTILELPPSYTME